MYYSISRLLAFEALMTLANLYNLRILVAKKRSFGHSPCCPATQDNFLLGLGNPPK